MTNKNDIFKISKEIYDLCCDYYKYEKFVKNITQNKKYKGYIINEVNITKFTNKIRYNELKSYLKKNNSYENALYKKKKL